MPKNLILWQGVGSLTAVINMAVALIVFLRHKTLAYRSFAYLSFALSVWNFSHVMTYPSYRDPFWMRVLFSSLAVLPPLTYAFAKGLTGDQIPMTPLRALYVLSAAFLITVWTPLFGVGAWGLCFVSFVFPVFFYCVGLFFWGWARASTAAQKNSLLYLCAASLSVVAGGFVEFLPRFGIWKPDFPFGSFSMMLYAVLVAYSIQKHQLLNVATVMQRGFLVGMAALGAGGASILAVAAAKRLPGSETANLFGIMYALMALGMVFWDYWGETIKVVFNREEYQRQVRLERWVRSLQGLMDFQSIAELTAELVRDQLGCVFSAVWLIDSKRLRSAAGDASPWEIYLRQTQSAVTRYEIDTRLKSRRFGGSDEATSVSLQRNMSETGCEVIVPIIESGVLTGALAAGPRQAGFFDPDVVRWLGQVSLALSQALETTRAHQELIHADRLVQLGVVAAGIAHEIRNPLAFLKGTVQLFQLRELEADKKKKLLEGVDHELSRLNNLVEDILSYAKPRVPKDEPCDLGTAINEMVEIASPSFINEVRLIWEKPLTPILVKMDPDHPKQIVLNLVRNAHNAIREAKRQGEIKIAVEFKNNRAVIEVSDNGPGMSNEQVAKLFQPFASGSASGTGLGLAIVDKLIRLYKGKIVVSSTLGQGSSFAIDFPTLT